jgi:hypothetical protein
LTRPWLASSTLNGGSDSRAESIVAAGRTTVAVVFAGMFMSIGRVRSGATDHRETIDPRTRAQPTSAAVSLGSSTGAIVMTL